MIRLTPGQWVVLAFPFLAILGFLGVAASLQIHQWHLNWIWAVIAVVLVGWRFLLVHWLKSPELAAAEAALDDWTDALSPLAGKATQRQQAEAEIRTQLQAAREDGPPWENWPLFFQRCQHLVEAIALIYHPQVKRPLLNIYVPQAYGLIRGTVDDVDQWMQKLSPLLGRVTIGQAYAAYETYQKLEPAARLALKAWNVAQWIFNPLNALARTATQGYAAQANQQLVTNLGQMLREATLKALGERAIALYSGETLQAISALDAPMPAAKTQTLRDILSKATKAHSPNTQPLNVVLMGRTGAGKSSLINTLFRQDLAKVDVLPSTDQMQSYGFETAGESLVLWDSPGYEQIDMEAYSQTVLAQAAAADLVLLVTPVTDPTLEMDREQLHTLKQSAPDLPILVVVTQVDRLRPLREWEPPYDWQHGDRPKERHIREAIAYRQTLLHDWCEVVLPLATEDLAQNRVAWGITELSQAILNSVEPAQQLRLSRFLRDVETRTQTAAKIIDHYAFQMGTTQGLTALLKSPALRFLSTLMTGSPSLAIVLAEKLPLEQSPVIVGKLQMAFELYTLLSPDPSPLKFDLLQFWPLLANGSAPIPQEAWALGHTLAEYWTQPVTATHLEDPAKGRLGDRYQGYLHLAQTHIPQK